MARIEKLEDNERHMAGHDEHEKRIEVIEAVMIEYKEAIEAMVQALESHRVELDSLNYGRHD